jgi:hypothetical protein
LAIFDPIFIENKIKSELPFLIARNAVNGSNEEQKRLLENFKKEKTSLPERFNFLK